MNKTLILLSAVAVILVSFVTFNNPAKRADASGLIFSTINTATTSAAFSVTTSARILATTTNPLAVPGVGSFTRIYATICNPNANPVFVNLDGDKPTDSNTGKATYVIAAAAGYQACYEISDQNQYLGSVTASSTNQTATVIFVKDYVQ